MTLAATRVLLVEDNPADARLLAEILSEAPGGPFALRSAQTLSEGLAMVPTCDVVLLDLTLPDAHGLQTVERMLAEGNDIPVVILTGTTDDLLATQAVQAGAQDYLVKGEITPALVSRTIRYAMDRKKAEENVRRLVAAQVANAKSTEATRRAEFLADAGGLLAASLDFEENAQALARLMLTTLADVCVIDMSDDQGRVLRSAEAARDGQAEQLLLQFRNHPGSDPRSTDRLAPRERVVIPHLESRGEPVAASDPRCVQLAALLGARSLVAVPLLMRGRLLGSLTLLYTESQRRHGPEEVMLAEEIARRAALAMENARLYREARLAVRARDEILAVVSHDLRNPLNVFALTLRALRPVLAEDARRREALARADRAYGRMVRLLEDLLDVARIDEGTLGVQRRRTHLEAALIEVVDMQRPLAAEKDITIDLETTGTFPVNLDRERFAQLMTNLMGNAIKFTPTGGRIQVRIEPCAEGVAIAVTDTGPGIPAENLPHVFDRFWQSGGSAKKEGIGLGLAIVKGIVDAHQGTISVTSDPGQGATFRFTLPAASEDDDEGEARGATLLRV